MRGIDFRIVDEKGKDLPWDGIAFGEVQGKKIFFFKLQFFSKFFFPVRGPFIAKSYYKNPDRSAFTPDGWFR